MALLKSFSGARSLAQWLTAALVASTVALAPVSAAPAFASGDPGWDSEIDYFGSFNNSSLSHASVSAQVVPDSGPFTVESWVSVSGTTNTWQGVVTQNITVGNASGFFLGLAPDGDAMHVAWNDGSGWVGSNSTPGSVQFGSWTHLAASFDGVNLTGYINGQKALVRSASAVVMGAGSDLMAVGARWESNGTPSQYFNGAIDQVKVWSSALSKADIERSMNTLGAPSGLAGLRSHFDFNEGSGATIYDRGSGGFDLRSSNLGFGDVKTQAMDGNSVVLTFPRTYLPGVGGWKPSSNVRSLSYLMVGGGGGGGGRHGGGGGAGGFRTGLENNIATLYPIVVGVGGLGTPRFDTEQNLVASGMRAGSGGDTVAFGLTVTGGGAGGGWGGGISLNGGSGGGASYQMETPGTGIAGQGFAGGAGTGSGADPVYLGGGGGGAASAGTNGNTSSQVAGAGGTGTSSSITGTSKLYAAGGGGGASATYTRGLGGSGIGGDGGSAAAGAHGSKLTGSGGGGAGHDSSYFTLRGGSGGSGVVIVRYTPQNTLTFQSLGSAVSSITADTGSSVARPTDPTTTSESIFLGWATTAGNASTIVTWPYAASVDQTLYGIWRSSPGLNSEIDYALDTPSSGVNGFGTESGQIIPASSSFTVEVWVKPDSLPNQWNQVVHNLAGNNFGRFDINVGAGVVGSSLIQVIYNPRTSDAVDGKYTNLVVPGFTAPVGQWTHIAVTVQVDKAQNRYFLNAYKNGQLVSGGNTATGITFQNLHDNFYVGYFSGQSRGFDGQIDQLKVWDTNLTQTQIEESMHVLGAQGVSGNPTLRASFDFNEPSGTATVTDRTLSGKNLVQVGSPSRVDTKVSSTTNGTTTLTFPRTYLPGVGGWTPPAGVTNAELLVVGGGGGGSGNSAVATYLGAAGSGGGGGVLRVPSVGLASPSAIKVGAGGVGGPSTQGNAGASGTRGQTSAFRSLTAGGGGAGGCEAQNSPDGAVCLTAATSGGAGTAAGSGGSPSNFYNAYSPGFAGTATATVMDGVTYAAVSGFRGGYFNDGSASAGNTAGSAGGAGGAGNRNTPGPGVSSTISGTAVSYGGGGASWNSSAWADAAPTANRGIGGNGGYKASAMRGHDGSAGVVIVRYMVATTPVITAQPQTVSATPGSTASFTVTATGNGTLSYQWQTSTDGANWVNVGSNQDSFSLSNVGVGEDELKIRVVVTNSINGTATLTSQVATLNVSGVTITAGGCAAMVANPIGVTISEAVSGGCLVRFTATGNNTFFVPQGVTSMRAFMVGGGGGGGGARVVANRGGGGGGGGGAANLDVTFAVTTSQEISLSVGAGGAGVANSNGATGSSTTLNYGSTVSSVSYVVSGGRGGQAPFSFGGPGGLGGPATIPNMIPGAAGGVGVQHTGTITAFRPANGNACWSKTFFSEFKFCVGGGAGGGNREVANDPFFNFVAVSTPRIGSGAFSGGSGGYHNGIAPVAATPGVTNTGGGGGGGSYNFETSTFRAGAAGADGVVMFVFTPGAGAISLSSIAPFSFSATTKTITLTKENPTSDVTWTTSNPAVCTVTGNASAATVTPVSPGVCDVSVNLAASAPFGKGSALTSFRMDKISRTAPTWINSSLSIAYGGSFDLRTNITNPGQKSYAFSTSGTVGSCSVTGYTLTVGSVGDTCDVGLTLVGDSLYTDMPATTALSVTVTRISQSALVITSGNQMNVGSNLTVSAAGGSGTGAISYHLVNDGGTGCQVDSSTGVVSGVTAAGNCTVYAKRASSTNFDEVTSSNQVISVSKISQVLNWISSPQPIVLAGTQYTVEATASSQLAIAYSIASGLCAITGNTVTFTGSGDCVIRAAQAGSSGYLAAQTISQTVSVGKINQTMTFSAIANKSWGSLAFSLSATASSGLAISYAENNQTTNDACDVSALGVVTVKNIGLCAVTATQAGDSSYTPVTTTQVFEVTPNPAGAPFIGSMSFADRQLNASFFTPSYLGGGSISAYELRAYKKFDGSLVSRNSGCIAQVGSIQTCSVSGLENGEVYVLRVAAITEAGLGSLSASSSEIIPAANPEAVSNLVAIEGNGQLTLRWTPAASLGGGAFDQYRIFWRAPGGSYQPNGSPGATVGSRNSTSYTITGLQNGVAYDVKVTTVTSINTLELQSNTAEVRQTPFTVPDAPAAIATFDNGSNVLVAWQPPVFDGGNPIDQYVVTKDGATVCSIISVTSTSCEVAKPASGTSTIEVKAGNDAGLSPAALATFTVPSLLGGGIGSSGLPIFEAPKAKPIVTGIDGTREVKPGGQVGITGENFGLVQRVLVDGVEVSFVISSDKLLKITLPQNAKPGDVNITLLGSFGTFILSNFITIAAIDISISSKVTVGSFNGFVAIYTKNLEGKRLSFKVGNRWRVVSAIPSNYTMNLVKVGRGKNIETKVYIDRQLVKISKLIVR